MTIAGTLELLWCPFPDAGSADVAAAALIDEGLAACVHVLPPVTSHYRWQGQREHSNEVPILCKIAAGGAGAARARIETLHPYDLPAIISWDAACSPAFAEWTRHG
jgi:periplasmic divalent cation tolerance protein